MSSTPDRRRVTDRAHEALLTLAPAIWLPLLERASDALYQWALARSKRY